jgi:hypothetical protein
MHTQSLKGKQTWHGEKAVAALQALAPQYGSSSMERPPLTCRCLKGWERLKPGQRKCPWAWPVWFRVGMHLWRLGLKQMAVAMLLQAPYYMRDTKTLKLTVGQIVALTSQSVAHWSLSLFPVERGDVSEGGQVDERANHNGWNSWEASQQELFFEFQRSAEVAFLRASSVEAVVVK